MRAVLSEPSSRAVHSPSDRHRNFRRRAGSARTPGRARIARGQTGSAIRPAAAAALSGVLLYVSFPPRTVSWLALAVAFAVFGWLLRGRSWKAGLGLGYLFGLGFLLPLLVWTGVEVGPGPWLALVAVEAVYVALVGAGITLVSRLPGWPLWAAAVWIAGEAARARAPFGGFPGARSPLVRRTASSFRWPRWAAPRCSASRSCSAASGCTRSYARSSRVGAPASYAEGPPRRRCSAWPSPSSGRSRRGRW